MNDPRVLLVVVSAIALAVFCLWTGYQLGKPKRDARGWFVKRKGIFG